MPLATKTWNFPSDAQSWASTLGASVTSQWQSADTSVADGSGCLEMTFTGSNTSSNSFWEVSDTWVNLFNIPSGANVTGVTACSHDWRCTAFTRGANTSATGPFELRDTNGNLVATLSSALTFSATGSFATQTGSALAVNGGTSNGSNNSAASTVRFRLNNTLATGSGANPSVILRQDQITVTIAYFVYRPIALGPSGKQFARNIKTSNFVSPRAAI